MNGENQMNADRSCGANDSTGAVIGAFYRVYNELGYGFLEAVDRRSLGHELRQRGVGVECERVIDVWYEGVRVGVFRADLVVGERVIVEIKTAQALGEADRKQLSTCMRRTWRLGSCSTSVHARRFNASRS